MAEASRKKKKQSLNFFLLPKYLAESTSFNMIIEFLFEKRSDDWSKKKCICFVNFACTSLITRSEKKKLIWINKVLNIRVIFFFCSNFFILNETKWK